MRGQSFGPLWGSLHGCHASIEIAVTTSLLPLIPEPINLKELNQVAVLVKHYKNRVPRFSAPRSKNPFVFCRLEMEGSLPACYFCFTNVHSYYIISETALSIEKKITREGNRTRMFLL